MKLDFDLGSVSTTEFGVGLGSAGNPTYRSILADGDVQDALLEMVKDTWKSMQEHEDGPKRFDISDKHGGTEYLTIQKNETLAKRLSNLHEKKYISHDAFALQRPSEIFCYFTRLIDENNHRLTALRRATHFKSITNGKAMLFRDELRIFNEPVFKLDRDFDLLIDSSFIHVWRSNAFVSLGALNQEILAAVPSNISQLSTKLPFVDFVNIQEYAQEHVRAAKYLASIRSQNLAGIEIHALLDLCEKSQIELTEFQGVIFVDNKSILKFLQALDRRIFVDELDPRRPEGYVAASRSKLAV